MKKLFLVLSMMLGVLCFGGKAGAQVVTVEEEVTYNYDEAYKLLDLVNTYRVGNGLAALQTDQNMMKVAMHRAGELQYSYSHTGPDGSLNAHENMVIRDTAEEAFKAWKDSTGHNAAMLDGWWKYCGVGFEGSGYVVLTFYSDAHEEGVVYNPNLTTKLSNVTFNDQFQVDTQYLDPDLYTVRADGVWVRKYSNEEDSTEEEKEEDKEEEEIKKPSKVSSVKLSRVKKSKKRTEIKVSYKKVSGCKYQVQLSTDKKFKKSTKTLTTSSTKKTYTKAYKGKRVYVRVRAFKTVKFDGESFKCYGKWSSVKSIKTYK